jgi:hypothetical protein
MCDLELQALTAHHMDVIHCTSDILPEHLVENDHTPTLDAIIAFQPGKSGNV